MGDCIFCKIVAGDIETDAVYEDDEVFAFKDIDPKAPVHVLIIPKAHTSAPAELGPPDCRAAGQMFVAAEKIARETGVGGAGYRLIINQGDDAGQEVEHLHMHLLAGTKLGPMVSAKQ
ncbi:MAG: histidine triad nucleotide-binding protein [Terriglobia bacterium]